MSQGRGLASRQQKYCLGLGLVKTASKILKIIRRQLSDDLITDPNEYGINNKSEIAEKS